MMVLSHSSAAQRVTVLHSFEGLSEKDLSNGIVRIEYRGPSKGLFAPVVFTTEGSEIDWKRIRAVPGLQVSELEERYIRHSFRVTTEDLGRFVGAAKTVVTPTLQPEPWLLLAVITGGRDEEKALIGSISREKAGDFFILARNALRADPKDISIMNGTANYEAMNVLQSFGCALGLLPEVIPAKDVTNAVAVTHSGLRFNFPEHRFESTVTLKNISSQPIRAPISLVVDFSSSNISLANAHARTCVTRPEGREFITIPLPTELFKPGQILETILVFAGAEGEDIDFSTKVLATPGER